MRTIIAVFPNQLPTISNLIMVQEVPLGFVLIIDTISIDGVLMVYLTETISLRELCAEVRFFVAPKRKRMKGASS
ncbi:hypothetical protein BW45_21750 [Agrobacterium tumefaciens]|nr:hypothetical protein BW45_21750 [Agrobacterium tumefaciens]